MKKEAAISVRNCCSIFAYPPTISHSPAQQQPGGQQPESLLWLADAKVGNTDLVLKNVAVHFGPAGRSVRVQRLTFASPPSD